MTPRKLFFSCLLLLFAACTERPKRYHPYTSDGLTMMLPPYWNVTKDKTDSTGIRLISILDTNPDHTGNFLTISAFNDSIDLKHYMELLIRNTTESMTKRDVPIKLVSKMEALRIGNLQAQRVSFECPIPDEFNSGAFTVFRLNQKTYSLTFITAGKNSNEKMATVDRIIRSFKKYSE